MRASIATFNRLAMLMCISICGAFAALTAAPWLVKTERFAMLLPACSAALALALAVIIVTALRFSAALRSDQAAAACSRSDLQVTLDNMSDGLVLCSATDEIIAVNKRFLALFNIPADRVRPKMPVADLIRVQAEAGQMTQMQTDALIHERMHRPPGSSGQAVMAFQQGEFRIGYQPRPEGGWACTFEDVTAELKAQRRLSFLAHHDPLTGLPNRTRLYECVRANIASGYSFSLLLLDLDHFKQANDTYGHAAGDKLLCAVATRLQAVLRDGDTLARLGGDEFVLVMNGPCSSSDADRQAKKIIVSMSEPFMIDERPIDLGASVGITQAADGSDARATMDVDTLLRQADTALYRAKQHRGTASRYFETIKDRPQVQ